jgi:hypothetical protein
MLASLMLAGGKREREREGGKICPLRERTILLRVIAPPLCEGS